MFEQLGSHCYENLQQLDCPHLGIKVVDLSPPAKFTALLRFIMCVVCVLLSSSLIGGGGIIHVSLYGAGLWVTHIFT